MALVLNQYCSQTPLKIFSTASVNNGGYDCFRSGCANLSGDWELRKPSTGSAGW
jgi:hypothetical protein